MIQDLKPLHYVNVSIWRFAGFSLPHVIVSSLGHLLY